MTGAEWLHARTAVDVEFADQLADIEPEIDAARLDVVHDQTEALRMGVFVDCTRLPACHLPTQERDGKRNGHEPNRRRRHRRDARTLRAER